MVTLRATVIPLWGFVRAHRLALLGYGVLVLLLLTPATLVEVEVLEDPSGRSYQQTTFWLGPVTQSESSIGVCRFSNLTWASDVQYQLFSGWIFAARMTPIVMFGMLPSYLMKYKLPIGVFAGMIFFFLVFLVVSAHFGYLGSDAPLQTTWCQTRPRLAVLYFIPSIVHVAFPLWWIFRMRPYLQEDPAARSPVKKPV